MIHDFQTDIDAVGRVDAVTTILNVVVRVTGLRFAAVARVTEDRWITCQSLDEIGFGLEPGSELVVETTICDEIRQSNELVVINHVDEDKLYCNHPTPAQYGFQSYISVPIIRADGSFFGTLCAIDPQPAQLRNPETIGMFRMFADLIAFHLDADRRLSDAESALLNEKGESKLREQFIAVLGHDLRNPVSSISSGAELLSRMPLGDKAAEIVKLMQGSTLRIVNLVDNLLDFARGRLGDGLTLERQEDAQIEPVLLHVIEELQSTSQRALEARLEIEHPVNCDTNRLGQLLSNLLGNALTHGAAGTPVRIDGSTGDGVFKLSVTNNGKPIPPSRISSLFQPFSRGDDGSNREGLGLGLFIASEIARAHGGDLAVTSSEAETRFTFSMPLP